MDRYHIFEEVGRGAFSIVFKGREKKKILFHAIRRIDKSRMKEVSSEVHMLHRLNHVNVIKFYDWYETRSSVWLILEYCTGGDLRKILSADGYLPETSLRIFALDIVSALRYLHSHGYLHGDLRPENFLVDEYGILKLSDFKATCKLPNDAVTTERVNAIFEGDSRFAPLPYTAPELLSVGGVQSYTSDLWSLGCVLYELRRGCLPFGSLSEATDDTSISDLVNHIRHSPPGQYNLGSQANNVLQRRQSRGPAVSNVQSTPSLPALSLDLEDLLMFLLEKTPWHRCDWTQLASHPFWGSELPLPPQQLPPHPLFEEWALRSEQDRQMNLEASINRQNSISDEMAVAYRNGQVIHPITHAWTPIPTASVLSSLHTTSPPGKISSGQTAAAASSSVPTPPAATPMKLPVSCGATPLRMENSFKSSTTPSEAYNETRSTVVRDLDKTPVVNRVGTVRAADVLQHTDMLGHLAPSNLPSTTIPPATAAIMATYQQRDNTPSSPTHTSNPPRPLELPVHPSSVNTARSVLPTQHSTFRYHVSPESLLLNAVDMTVKPILFNNYIEEFEVFPFTPASYSTSTAAQLRNLSDSEVYSYLQPIFNIFLSWQSPSRSSVPTDSTITALRERINLLAYLCSIAVEKNVANTILNSHVISVILGVIASNIDYGAVSNQCRTTPRSLSEIPATTSPGVLATLLSQHARYISLTLLGLLLRFADFIDPPPSANVNIQNLTASTAAENGDILGTLTALLRNPHRFTDQRLKVRIMAALGELVFYISVQFIDDDTLNEAERSKKWHLPTSTLEVIGQVLSQTDVVDTLRHYAAKIVENVLLQGLSLYRRRFLTNDICTSLVRIMTTTLNDKLRMTATVAVTQAVHLILSSHSDPSLSASNGPEATSSPFREPVIQSGAQFIARILSPVNFSNLVTGLKDRIPREQQAIVRLICTLLCAPLVDAQSPRYDFQDRCHYFRTLEQYPNTHTISFQGLSHDAVFAAHSALTPLRSSILKIVSPLTVTLLQLYEQSGHHPTRTKACLCLQLLCVRSKKTLQSLPDRKLSAVLMRLLEPFMAATSNGATSEISFGYFNRVGLSLLLSIQRMIQRSLLKLHDLIPQFANSLSHFTTSRAGNNQANTIPGNGSRSKSTAKPGLNPAVTAQLSAINETVNQLSALLEIVSPPALYRLALATNSPYLLGLGEVFSDLGKLQQSLDELAPAHLISEAYNSIELIENVCFHALELSSMLSVPFTVSGGSAQPLPPGYIDLIPDVAPTVLAFLTSILPRTSALLERANVNHRTIIVYSYRRLMPMTFRFFIESDRRQEAIRHTIYQKILPTMQTFLKVVPQLLGDGSPVPEYTMMVIRAILEIHPELSVAVVHSLKDSDSLSILIRALDAQTANPINSVEEETNSVVPMTLLLLLRSLMTETPDIMRHLVEANITRALTNALKCFVFRFIPSPFTTGSEVPTDELLALLELLQTVLHYSLLLAPDNSSNAILQTISVACEAGPSLLLLLAYVDFLHRSNGGINGEGTPAQAAHEGQGAAAWHGVADYSARSLGILIDLFRDTLVVMLLSRSPLTPYDTSLTPRVVIAKVLRSSSMDGRVVLKFAKILSAVLGILASRGSMDLLTDLISSEPIRTAVYSLTTSSDVALSKICNQMLEYIRRK